MESNWWQGPEWLRYEPQFWPHSEIDLSDAEIYKEKRKNIISMVAPEKVKITENFNKFSSYGKVIKMIGWILRFSYNVKNKGKRIKGELNYEEIEESETRLLKIIQLESFGKIDLGLIHDLQVFEDNRGILRIETKLMLREDTNYFKFPILLPSNHEIVNKLILEQHRLEQHAGITTLSSILGGKF
ncbi:hypothetical protein JTB14_015433 [Gonioctena quinquepunctata]|nr:hypothetical protein JTB14_015433 [Gonioctena quinquepunctata]